MATILITDDDADIRKLLNVLLINDGYTVLEARNGEEALMIFDSSIDLVILDVMMPGMDGITACAELRKRSTVPVLFLTAKGQEYDKIIGFSSGGDNYLTKPFVPSELSARVRAMLRRYHEYSGGGIDKTARIKIGGLEIDADTCNIKVDGEEKNLTAIEYRILLLMAKTKGKVFSAQNIYESIWEEPYFHTSSNTVMVHIRKLREKIEKDPQKPQYLKTVWGMGYKLTYER